MMMEDEFSNISAGVESGSPTLFVGSLSPECTPESIEAYFSQFGGQVHSKIIVDWVTLRSKQCALLFCPDVETAENILSKPDHVLGGKLLRVTWADEEKRGTKKIDTANIGFVGNISQDLSEQQVAAYFCKFGEVSKVKFFKNKSTADKTKNAFIKFKEEEGLKAMLAKRHSHRLDGRLLKCAPFKPNSKAYQLENVPESAPPTGSFGGKRGEVRQYRFQEQYDTANFPQDPQAMLTTALGKIGSSAFQGLTNNTSQGRAKDTPATTPPFSSSQSTEKSEQCLNFYYVHAVEFESDELFKIFCPLDKEDRNSKPSSLADAESQRSDEESTSGASRGSSLYC
jgi:RNA recognition motif-containing protein